MQKETVAKGEERLKYLMLSFPQPLTVRPDDPRAPSPLSWKTGTRSRMEPHTPEKVSALLCHSDTPKPMGLDGIHPQGGRELAAVIIIYQQPWQTGRSQLSGSHQR